MHPIHQWREVQEQLRLNKIYQGLRVKDDRPRYVFHDDLSLVDFRKKFRNRKTIALFPPLNGNRRNGIKIPGLKTLYRPIMGASPEDYYVSTDDGNDGYNGLYPTFQGGSDGPWLTVGKVNGETFSAADYVAFNRGNSWSGTRFRPPDGGSGGTYITYGDYGSGALPIIRGANNGTQTIFVGDGLGYIIVENIDFYAQAGDEYNVMCGGIAGLDHVIFRGLTVRGAVTIFAVLITGYAADVHDITIDDCEISDAATTGIHVLNPDIEQGGPDNITITNNIVRDNGTDTSQHHGIYIKQSSNLTVRGNTCYDNAGSGIVSDACLNVTVDGNTCYGNERGIATGTSDQIAQNFLVKNNLLYANVYNIRIGGSVKLEDVYFYNNTLVNATTAGLWVIITDSALFDNVQFKNNIVLQDGATVGTASKWPYRFFKSAALSGPTMDYNCVAYIDGTNGIASADDMGPPYYWTWATWQALSHSPDANSINSDPLFLTEFTDLHLQSGSPCIDDGVDVGIDKDFDGVPRGRGTAPDIGAYETLKGGPRRL